MSRGAFQPADRLIVALDDLLSREAHAARSGSGLRVRDLQARIEPLVAALANLAGESPGHGFSAKVASLVEKRRQNIVLMQESLGRMRSEIDARAETLARIRRVSPAYLPQANPAPRLDVTR